MGGFPTTTDAEWDARISGGEPMKRTVVIPSMAVLIAIHFGLPATAADLVVDRFDDAPFATMCHPGVANDCSLRGAILRANQDTTEDTITLPAGTYTLTVAGVLEDAAATGDLDITAALEIHGEPGVVIDGNGIDRVFHTMGNQLTRFYDLTITGGSTPAGVSDYGGGGVLNEGASVGMYDCVVSDNTTHEVGGGIYNFNGSFVLVDTRVTGNESETHGGGVFNQSGGVLVAYDTVLDANVALAGGGGGLYNNGSADLDRSSIYSNQAHEGVSHGRGGGVYNVGFLVLTNCSLILNLAFDDAGGAIYNGDEATLRHISISGNFATSGRAVATGPAATTTFANSLVEGECANTMGSVTSLSGNLESPGNTCGFNVIGDMPLVSETHTFIEDIDGGPGKTLALEITSPALDTANAAECEALDQRSLSRPIDGDGDGEARCDRGAYEYHLDWPIFLDGFEGGDTTDWSNAMP
jgi:hypothetical protein